MRHRVLPRVRRHFVLLVAACIALLGCDHTSPYSGPVGCPFVLNLALLSPSGPRLHIGDTLTMHVKSWAPVARECLPPDTTAAGLWWSASSSEIAIDSRGHVTAVRPGSGIIALSQFGDSGALGQTDDGVYEPPGADSVVTIIRNRFEDSVRVALQDANGALQRSQTVAAQDSACWVTPLSDSLRYTVLIYVPGTDSGARWLAHSALLFNHRWIVAVYHSGTLPSWTWSVFGVSPDPGTGC
jgi:hypothetical protein